MNLIYTNRKGVTLIELILALAIMGIIVQVIYSLYYVSRNSFEISKDIGFAQQDTRLISDYINKELRFASKVFIENPGTLTPSIDNYYTLSLEETDNNDKRLTIIHSSDSSKNKIISNKVSSIDFKPLVKYDENNIEYAVKRIIKLTVLDVENGHKRVYSMDIKLENDTDFTFSNTTDVINTIYYTKYD